MSLMDRFTKHAKLVLVDAQQEAHRLGHDYSGTEHLLLGLVRSDGIAGEVLREMGVDLQRARSAVEFIVGHGEGVSDYAVELTASAKKVIEYAVEEARKLHHHYVGPEHLLLGLIMKGEGVASGVLDILGVEHPQLAQAVFAKMGLADAEQRAAAIIRLDAHRNQAAMNIRPQRRVISWLLAAALGAALMYISRLQRALQAARQRGDTYRDLLGDLDRSRDDQP